MPSSVLRLLTLFALVLALPACSGSEGGTESGDRSLRTTVIVDNNTGDHFNVYAGNSFLGRVSANGERRFSLPSALVESNPYLSFEARIIERTGGEGQRVIRWDNRPVRQGETIRLEVTGR